MELKAKLAKCVNTVFDLLSDGDVPRQAIVKAASAESLLPDQVTRLCQLYNRSAALSHRLSPGDLGAKLADAQVVDPREVLKDMFQRKLKQASFPAMDSVLVDRSATTQKQASATSPASPTPVSREPEGTSSGSRFSGLHHGVSGMELVELRQDIKKKMASLLDRGEQLLSYVQTTHKLAATSVQKLARMGSPEAVKQAEFYLRDDQEALEHLARFCETLPSRTQSKLASMEASPPSSYQAGVIGPRSAVEYVQRAAEATRLLLEEGPVLAGKIAAMREEDFLIRTHTQGNKVHNWDVCLGEQTLQEKQQDHLKKVAGMATATTGSWLASFANKKDQEPGSFEKFQLKLSDPAHNSALASVRSRAALQELLVDDPVISSMPDDDVLEAYNEIAAFAPQLAESPATLRAVLRQYMQNNASTFDLAQLRQLERTPGLKNESGH